MVLSLSCYVWLIFILVNLALLSVDKGTTGT